VAAAERSEAEAEAAVKAEQVVMLGLAAIRLAALQSLVMLANSDARIAAMVEAGVPEVNALVDFIIAQCRGLCQFNVV
jgi:hypothetical protein